MRGSARCSLQVWTIALLVIAGVLLGARVTSGSHVFSDVATSALYHSATEWLANRSITLGCSTGLYCPDDFVTRGQMALFMNRLGVALTPSFLNVSASPGALDIDTSPTVCETSDFMPAFPMQARGDAWVSLRASVALGARLQLRYSTNAGVSWTTFGGLVSRMGAIGDLNAWSQGVQMGFVDLAPGFAYRFSIQVSRESGIANPANSHCEIMIVFMNRNPTTSPLSVPQRDHRGR